MITCNVLINCLKYNINGQIIEKIIFRLKDYISIFIIVGRLSSRSQFET